MSLPFVTLDVFTTEPFRGNPLAIVQVPASITLAQEQKQLIAREFNLSETVFLHEQTAADKESSQARIDIFTPWAELPFAGHPTVGTSFYLQHDLKIATAKALLAKAGVLPFEPATVPGGAGGVQLGVAHNVHFHDAPFKDRDFGHFPVVSIVKGMTFILAQQSDLAALAGCSDSLLGSGSVYGSEGLLDEGWQVGLIPTYFYVDMGVAEDGTRLLRTRTWSVREDPATGSAASALCSYLSLTEKEGGKGLVRKYHITQGVEMGRESNIFVEVALKEGGESIDKVLLSGSAVKVLEGKVPIPQISA